MGPQAAFVESLYSKLAEATEQLGPIELQSVADVLGNDVARRFAVSLCELIRVRRLLQERMEAPS